MNRARFGFEHRFRVAWGDMDALGHVNNVAFNRYFESARAEYFTARLLHRVAGRREDTGPVVTGVNMEYHRQVHFPADLLATVGVLSVSSRLFELGFSLWSGSDFVAGGVSRHMWLDFGSGRPIRIPPEFVTLLKEEKRGDTRSGRET